MTQLICRPASLLLFGVLLFSVSARARVLRSSQSIAPVDAKASEFRRLVSQLLDKRQGTGETNDEAARLEDSALGILDNYVLGALNAPGKPELDTLRGMLQELLSTPAPVKQEYELVPLGGSPVIYALVANFGSSGPSAVRIYARDAEKYHLAARIDLVAQTDFFDDYLVLLPIASDSPQNEAIFVTVTGRTDEYLTGVFAAWRIAGDHLQELWASDLMPHSSYEVRSDGFQITYCAETIEDNPQSCRRMARDRYSWDGTAWHRDEQTDLGPPKS